jgi:hypothetical protein
MKVARLTLFAVVALIPLMSCTGPRLPADRSIPEWLRQVVSASRRPPPEIEKVTYKGQPAFNLVATDRADTGGEHALYSAGGTLICRYGGLVGRVTTGSCDLDKIIYLSTLYDPRNR